MSNENKTNRKEELLKELARWGLLGWYNRLPKYARESLIYADKTDVSKTAYFRVESGIAYFNACHEDVMDAIRWHRSEYRPALESDGNIDPSDYITEMWEY